MNLSIDITESFGTIDYDNAGGVISYINIPPTENSHNELKLEIFNVVINLIDEPVIYSIANQNPEFLKDMNEDGFLILKKAVITFREIKGYEKLIRLLDQEQGYLIHESYGLKLDDEDKIYDIGGRSFSTPALLINLAIISPKKVILEFNASAYTYIATYDELQRSVETINLKAKRAQPPIQGLFDTTYSNKYTASDFDAGYRVYKT